MEIKILGTFWISIHIIMHLGPKILLNFWGGLEKFPPLKKLPRSRKIPAMWATVGFFPPCRLPRVLDPVAPPRDMPSSRGASPGGKRMDGAWKTCHSFYFFLKHKYNGACIGRERQKYDYGASSSGVIVGCFETYGALLPSTVLPPQLSWLVVVFSTPAGLACVWIDCFSDCAGFCFEGWN